MVANPLNERQMKRLRAAERHSREQLRVFRENRMAMVEQFVGKNYSDKGAADKVPLNLLELAITIYLMHLAANNPAVTVSTVHRKLKPEANLLELAVNHQLAMAQFETDLQAVTMDALFSMGIMKVGLGEGMKVRVDGQSYEIGKPFAGRVDLDDWVHDTNAKDFRQCQFMGDRYRLPLDAVRDSDIYDKKFRDALEPVDTIDRNEQGDTRVESLSRRESMGGRDTFEEEIELIDLFLPRQQLLVTVEAKEDSTRIGRIVEWPDPDIRPYHRLGFFGVPNNIMPLSPMALLMDLHELANKLFNKIARQADRQKTVYFVKAGADKDGKRLIEAADGDMYRVDDPQSVAEVSYGGPNGPVLAFVSQLRQLFAYLGGNLDVIGGLGAQSPTLGQDELISASASKRVEYMQKKSVTFTAGVCTDFAWHLYTDPISRLQLSRSLPGVPDVAIDIDYGPEDRTADFFRFNFNVEPYSLQHQSPQQKANQLLSLFNGVIAPMLPFLSQAGATLDFEKFIKLIGKYSGREADFADILTFSSAEGMPRAAGGTAPVKPAVTRRIHERVSRPGAVMAQQENALVQALMGIGQQPKESSTMFRQAG